MTQKFWLRNLEIQNYPQLGPTKIYVFQLPNKWSGEGDSVVQTNPFWLSSGDDVSS